MVQVPLHFQFIFSVIASIGFAIYLNVPKIDLMISGLIAGIGWILYVVLNQTTAEVIMPYFFATLTIGVLGNFFAKYSKKPTIVYILPGIIPLVPGYSMYYTMLYIVTKEYDLAIKNGINAIFIALAISSALLLTESLRKITNNFFGSLKKRRNKFKAIQRRKLDEML